MMPQSLDHPHAGLQDYLQATQLVRYGNGQQILEPSSHDLCHVVTGVVELRWRGKHYGFALPGDFFGEMENTPHESAIVRVECELMRWNPAYIEARIHTRPELAWELLKLQSARNQRLKEMLAIAHRTCKHRLVWYLLSLTRQFERAGLAKPVPETLARDATMLPSWITHQVLSGVIGTSREIVTQTLQALRKDGAFSGRRGHWQVAPAVLERLMADER